MLHNNNKVPWLHLRHTWIYSDLHSGFKCIVCNAEVTEYQFENYPFMSYFTPNDPNWYDNSTYWYAVICDEIWNRLKSTGYMHQRIHTPNPERVRSWLWDVGLIRKEDYDTSFEV